MGKKKNDGFSFYNGQISILALGNTKSCLLAIAAYKALTPNTGIHAPQYGFGSYFFPVKNSKFWLILWNGLDIHFNVVPNLSALREGNAWQKSRFSATKGLNPSNRRTQHMPETRFNSEGETIAEIPD